MFLRKNQCSTQMGARVYFSFIFCTDGNIRHESVPESMPDSVPESVPESMPESVPESVALAAAPFIAHVYVSCMKAFMGGCPEGLLVVVVGRCSAWLLVIIIFMFIYIAILIAITIPYAYRYLDFVKE